MLEIPDFALVMIALGDAPRIGDRRKVRQRVVRHFVDSRVDQDDVRHRSERIAVRRGTCDRGQPDTAGCADAVFDNDALVKPLRQFGCQQAGDDVARSASGERHHDGDRALRPFGAVASRAENENTQTQSARTRDMRISGKMTARILRLPRAMAIPRVVSAQAKRRPSVREVAPRLLRQSAN